MTYRTDLSVKIGSLTLKNPVMPASGTYGYFEDNANVFPMDALGAIVLKSVHRHPRGGNKAPRFVEAEAGMINAVGIPTCGIERFLETELSAYAALNVPLILSLSGSQTSDYIESAEMLSGHGGIAAVEINLSCPNVGTGLTFASDAGQLSEVVRGVRACTGLPLIAKLSPNVTNIAEIALAAQESGIDAVTIANTFSSMKIDLRTQKPYLGNVMGGLSGPCIRPIITRMVYQAYQKLSIPIIACGGITRWEDAVEFILAGATAVQVGCGNFVNPMLMVEVIDGIDGYLAERGCGCLEDIRGRAHRQD